jgi:hypothetical protein
MTTDLTLLKQRALKAKERGGFLTLEPDEALSLLADREALKFNDRTAMREASDLAMWLFNTYYRDRPDQPAIKLLTDTAGVITQIDNMVSGMRDLLEAAEARATALEESLRAILENATEGEEFTTLGDDFIVRGVVLRKAQTALTESKSHV